MDASLRPQGGDWQIRVNPHVRCNMDVISISKMLFTIFCWISYVAQEVEKIAKLIVQVLVINFGFSSLTVCVLSLTELIDIQFFKPISEIPRLLKACLCDTSISISLTLCQLRS